MSCTGCSLSPCVCSYIVKLGRGGQWEWARTEALKWWDIPQPDGDTARGKTYHYSTCPCPPCQSLRLATFENYGNVVEMKGRTA